MNKAEQCSVIRQRPHKRCKNRLVTRQENECGMCTECQQGMLAENE